MEYRHLCFAFLSALAVSLTAVTASRADSWDDSTTADGWAWQQLRQGRRADFNDRCGDTADLINDTLRRAQPCRAVSATFISQLFNDPGMHNEMQRYSTIEIIGARINGDIDASASVFPFYFLIFASAIHGNINLWSAQFAHNFSLIDDNVFGRVSGYYTNIKESLIIDGGNYEGSLWFDASTIGKVYLSRANFKDGLGLPDTHIGSTGLTIVGISIPRGSIFFPQAGEPPLSLSGAVVEGSVNMESFSINELDADGLNVGGDFTIHESGWNLPPYKGRSTVKNAKIARVFSIQHSHLGTLDLSGSTMSTFDLADVGWLPNAKLILRNTRANALQDSPASWPETLSLDGFVFDHLGAYDTSTRDDIRHRPSVWWREWLERDPDYNPQPYTQLATVFRTSGNLSAADDIQYFSRERERNLACQGGDRDVCLRLTALSWITGYGIGSYTFRVLYWVVGLTVLGVIVLSFSEAARKKGLPWLIGASLQKLLPVVVLSKEFDDFFDDPRRERVHGLQLAFFASLSVLGWILGLFLVAALSGLSQKP